MYPFLIYYAILALRGTGAAVTAWEVREDNSDRDIVALSLLQHDLHHETSSSSSHHRLTTAADVSGHSRSDALMLLPSIDCVRIITLNGSEMLGPLRKQLEFHGLWNRTTVQTEQLDPEGGRAGCFRAHVRAWNFGLIQECTNLLVLEDDAYFDNETVQASMGHADAFLQSGLPYDTFYLGWNPFSPMISITTRSSRLEPFLSGTDVQYDVQVFPIDGMNCVFQLWGTTGSSHAYVISKTAMQKFSSIQYQGSPVDFELRKHSNISLTVRPMPAFQRYHETSIPWSDSNTISGSIHGAVQNDLQRLQGDPVLKREKMEDPVYEASGYGDMCAI